MTQPTPPATPTPHTSGQFNMPKAAERLAKRNGMLAWEVSVLEQAYADLEESTRAEIGRLQRQLESMQDQLLAQAAKIVPDDPAPVAVRTPVNGKAG